MIEIKFAEDNEMIEVVVEGHAGYAKKGEDIVCSAVSVLIHTLAAEVIAYEDLLDDQYIELAEGKSRVRAYPKAENRHIILLLYSMIQMGCYLIARNYPKNVQLTELLRV